MAMEGMATDGSVRLSSEEISTFGITFGRAEIRPLGRTIRVAGYVEFDETRVASVSPRFPGWAERSTSRARGWPGAIPFSMSIRPTW